MLQTTSYHMALKSSAKHIESKREFVKSQSGIGTPRKDGIAINYVPRTPKPIGIYSTFDGSKARSNSFGNSRLAAEVLTPGKKGNGTTTTMFFLDRKTPDQDDTPHKVTPATEKERRDKQSSGSKRERHDRNCEFALSISPKYLFKDDTKNESSHKSILNQKSTMESEEDGHMETIFFEEKLKLLESAKKELQSGNALTEFFFKTFQEAIDHESRYLQAQLLEELKTGLHEQFLQSEQMLVKSHNKVVGLLKEEIVELKSKLQKERESSASIKDLYKSALKYKLESETLNSEMALLNSKLQECQALCSAKAEKITELESAILHYAEHKMKSTKKVEKYKYQNKEAMHILNVLRFKGIPVSEIYESEVNNFPLEKSNSVVEVTTEPVLNKSFSNLMHLLEDSNLSFQELNGRLSAMKHGGLEAGPDIHLNESLFSVHLTIDNKKKPVAVEVIPVVDVESKKAYLDVENQILFPEQEQKQPSANEPEKKKKKNTSDALLKKKNSLEEAKKPVKNPPKPIQTNINIANGVDPALRFNTKGLTPTKTTTPSSNQAIRSLTFHKIPTGLKSPNP